MQNPQNLLPVLLILLLPHTLSAAPGDADNDGLRDAVETNTGVFASASNTGTNPAVVDSDGDFVPDGIEVGKGSNPTDSSSTIRRPNIIFIMVDDLGYGDLGCFWQNQRTGVYRFDTPQLDRMAADGAMMTHHYTSVSICAGARASFLQGLDQGHADIRQGFFDSPLPLSRSIPFMLRDSGYRTVHIGKAGLAGNRLDQITAHPNDRGFDRFFGYLLHSHAHEHYPLNGAGKNGAVLYSDYAQVKDAHQDLFTSDAFTAFAKKEIIEQTTQRPNQPFFIYLAYDTPHFDLQFPPTATYPAGRGLSGGLTWMGTPSYVNTATNDPAKINNLSNAHPSCPASMFLVGKQHVSMIRRIDDSVQDLLQTLRDLGIANDTLVVFTSDNGPASDGIYPPTFQSYAGFEGIKGDLLEGGIRVPTIAWWPGKIPANGDLNNIRRIDRPSAHHEWLATFAEMACVQQPVSTTAFSLLPTLTMQGVQRDKGYLYFEMSTPSYTPPYPDFTNNRDRIRGEMQAIRKGPFMGLRTGITTGNEDFTIYNVVTDPKQGTNLASSMPDLNIEMKRLALGGRRKGVNLNRTYDSTRIPAFQPKSPVKAGLKWKSYEGYWPWLPDFRTLAPVAGGESLSITPALRSRNTDVGLLFDGYLSITTAGTYTFQVASSAESSLWIHESNVIDNDFAYSPVKTSGSVQLSTGLHPFRLFFRHRSGTPSLELRYSGPGIAMQPIHASAFFVDGQPTVLQPDAASTTKETPVTINVLANDTAQNPLSLQSVGSPSGGSAAIMNGQIRYTPSARFLGFDQFSYTVNDGFTPVSSSVSATVFFDNEIWLPLDEGAGTSINAYGASSTVVGNLSGAEDPAQSWTNGKLGKALRLDGIDDQVVFPALQLPAAGSPRSFSCWLKTSNTSLAENQTIFTYGPASGGGQRFTVRLTGGPSVGSLVASVEALPGAVAGTKTLNDGSWHHLAIVVADHDNNGVTDIAETKIYVDGLPDTLSSSNPGLLGTVAGTSACLGGSDQSAACNYKGLIDDVRVFPRALSGSEVQTLRSDSIANAGIPPDDSDGDGILDADEGIAGTNPDDPASFFKIQTSSITGSGISLQWVGVAGRTYRVEESSNLHDWILIPGVAPVVVTANTPNASVTVPASGTPKRFVRLQVMLSQ